MVQGNANVRAGRVALVAQIDGEVDYDSVNAIRPELLGLAGRCEYGLVLDLSEVSFMDCAGLSLLVALRRETLSQGVRLTLTGVPQNVRRLMALADLTASFDIADLAAPVGISRDGQWLLPGQLAGERPSGGTTAQ